MRHAVERLTMVVQKLNEQPSDHTVVKKTAGACTNTDPKNI
jgi:hypothetical protein